MKKRILFVLVFIILAAWPSFAATAEGGDGSGGGSDVGLALTESSVPNGSTGVPLETDIVLTFNKNVVNMSVKDNNMGCFTLTSDGGAASVGVIMGDDQVDPSIKRIITIRPDSPLSPETTYTLTISKNLTSKSGSSLSQDVVITFTTVSAPAPDPETVSPSPAAVPSGPVTTSEPSPSPAAPSAPPEESPASPSASAASVKPSSASAPSGETAPDATAAVPSPSPDTTPPPEMAEDTGDSEGNPVSPLVYIGGGAAVVVIGGTAWAIIRKRK